MTHFILAWILPALAPAAALATSILRPCPTATKAALTGIGAIACLAWYPYGVTGNWILEYATGYNLTTTWLTHRHAAKNGA